MEFTNEFTIPLGIDRSLEVLTDLERVAPCFPGATLEEVDGDTYSGRVKVKLGPMSLTYSGDATVTEVDQEAHTARIEASGREKRGSGTAAADVHADLTENDDGSTTVKVITDINITGKPAQFGRGVMDDVGAKIIDRFAGNLREQLEEESAAAPASTDDAADGGSDDGGVAGSSPDDQRDDGATASGAGASSGPRKVEQVAPRDDALDLADVAGEATAKRLLPVAVAAVVVLILWLVLRDGGDDEE